MTDKTDEGKDMPNRASDKPTDSILSWDRRVPVWGIITVLTGMFLSSVGFCLSFYISSIRMSDSLERLTIAVDKQVQNDIQRNITQIEQRAAIVELQKSVAKNERDIEILRTNQRWTPK